MYYLIRHGQTEGNKHKKLQGRSNLPLNEKGREQAAVLGAYFREKEIHFSKIYSSPLTRAMETARIVASNPEAELIVNELLLEMDYGPYEGTSLEQPPQEVLTFFADFVHQKEPEGMEPLDSVTGRMGKFLEQIKVQTDENILISTHAIAMKGALEYLTEDSNGAYWSKYIANCGVYVFDVIDGKYTRPVELIGDGYFLHF